MKLSRKKEETYEEYFYQMIAIAKNVEIGNQAVIKYITSSLNQTDIMRWLLLQLQDSPIELLRRIKNHKDIMLQERYQGEQRLNKTVNKQNTACCTEKIQYYNRNQLGYISTRCPKSPKTRKCHSCNKFDHFAATYVKIGGIQKVALIDSGSDVNLSRLSEYLEA